MAKSPVFAEILDQPASDVKPPPLLPIGTYLTILVGLPETGQSTKKQTEFFKFTHKIIAADEDVNEEELNEQFPDGISGKTITNTLYLTENALFMLTDFLKNCGIDLEGKSVRACIGETVNREVKVFIKHEPNEDGTRFFAKVGRTLPAD